MNLDQDKWIDWPSVGKFLSEEDAAEVACVSHLFARAFHLKKVRVTRWSSICEMLPLLEQAGCQSVHVEDECDALPEELVMLRSLTALNLTLSSQISDPRGVGASIQSLSKLQHLSLYLDENFEEFVDGLTGTHNQIPLFPQLESLHLTLRGVVNSASSIEQLRRLLESFSQYEKIRSIELVFPLTFLGFKTYYRMSELLSSFFLRCTSLTSLSLSLILVQHGQRDLSGHRIHFSFPASLQSLSLFAQVELPSDFTSNIPIFTHPHMISKPRPADLFSLNRLRKLSIDFSLFHPINETVEFFCRTCLETNKTTLESVHIDMRVTSLDARLFELLLRRLSQCERLEDLRLDISYSELSLREIEFLSVTALKSFRLECVGSGVTQEGYEQLARMIQNQRKLRDFLIRMDAHASPASITSLHTALLSLDSLVHLDFDLSSHMDQTRLFWDLMLDVCVAQPNLNSLRLRLVDCCLDTRALDVMIDSWVHGINRFGRPLAYLEHLELLVGGMNFSVFDMAYRAKLESLPLIPDVALELMEEPSIIIDNIEYYWGYDVCSDFLDEKKMNHRLAFALRTRTQEMKIDFEDPQY
eukprot:TRINITY_DN1740_c0_g1_i4.p1 TRINITY_DN1740_c0_g1~~TRINITY_DN1740_c0_g1_i4.p1  ORF type:complete len:586 (-),score=12.00 TRINITY_DN1740_c0_g1_i4:1-1758(-)